MRCLSIYRDEKTGKIVEEWKTVPDHELDQSNMYVMPPIPGLEDIVAKVRAEKDGIQTFPKVADA